MTHRESPRIRKATTAPLAVLLLVAGCAAPRRASAPVPDGALRVGFVLLDGVYGSELVAPHDIFHHTRFHTDPGMHVFTVGRTLEPVTSFEGLAITPDYSLASAPPIDVLVMPSAKHNMTTDLADAALIDWVRERGRAARYVLSVCDGSFVLAAAGLLDDGQVCTTFPDDLPAFRARFPQLRVVEDVTFAAGPKVITGAGGARSYEPALFLVERLYGKRVAEGVAKGMLLDWKLESIAHAEPHTREASTSGAPQCWLPGDRVDASVAVEDDAGNTVTLGEIAARRADTKAIVLALIAGAEGGDTRRRGGVWCEDTFGDLAMLRHLRLVYEPKGVRFVAVCCPPVCHENEFGYDAGAFLTRAASDAVYRVNRERFVERTRALRATDALPFDELYFDPRFRLLGAKPATTASAAAGPRPSWQGRFRWYRDTQTYGTPTIWVLGGDLTVHGAPFFMNVYESPGRELRYTAREIGARLTRVLRGQ